MKKQPTSKAPAAPATGSAAEPAPALIGGNMAIEIWPIDRPIPYPKNARKWSDRAIATVAASLREYGFRQPIVVDAQDVICIGHLRLKGAQSLGLKEVPVHVARDLTPAQIKGLRIADNRTSQEASWDFDLLAPELLDLKTLGFDLMLTGFEQDEMVKVLAPELFGASDDGETSAGSSPQLGDGLEYRVVVDCSSELQQTELLDRFEAEGLTCRALIGTH